MLGWLRLDVVKLLILALPALAIKQLLLDFRVQIGDRVWSLAEILLPVLLAGWTAWWVWQLRRADRPKALGRGYLGFFPIYCLLFATAADLDVLTGPRRPLSGYEEKVPPNFLHLNRLGDWHYWWAPEAPPAHDLIVVTFPSFAGELREDVRRNFAFLIRKAVENQARGIAFDYYLERESAADPLLERLLGEAESAGMPVFFGYQHEEVDGMIVRRPIAPSLADALPLERLGHLAGYMEYDDRVRMLPVNLAGFGSLPSLASRIASVLAEGETHVPEDRLLKFTRPQGGVRIDELEAGAAPDLDWRLWRDRFIVVGSRQESDLRATPFGVLPGVVIHAYAAHSLRSGCFIRRLDPSYTFPVIFLGCYLLLLAEARGVPRRTLLTVAGLLSVAVLTLAALAMRYLLVWIDVSYPLFAIFDLTATQIAVRVVRARWQARAQASASASPALEVTEAADSEAAALEPLGFDVFLSHNGRDKPAVKGIGKALKARGLKPWLDEWELVPGRPWQEALEEIILTVRSSAVFVGRDGLGPWEIPEMRASLSECVRRGLPVIPVLLPGASEQPALPLFLTQYTWVDFRAGVSDEILDRLEWGITGVKPVKRV